MKSDCDIVYDQSGTILDDVFYEFRVQYDDFCIDDDRDDSWIVVSMQSRGEPEPNWLWAEVLHKDMDYLKYRYDCSFNPKHKTQSFYMMEKTYADLLGGDEIIEFVPPSMTDAIVVSEKFLKRLKETELTGFQFSPLEINVNQSDANNPRLFIMEFTGTMLSRPCQVIDKPNACPWCGTEPLICPKCGDLGVGKCSNCGRETVTSLQEYKKKS